MSYGVDIFTSRRNKNDECLFWHRRDDEDLTSMVNIDHDYEELIYDRSPDGSFFANEVSPRNSSNKTIGMSFMFDASSIMLETNDDVSLLSQNDLIYHDGNIWIVTSIQKTKYKRQNQFSKECGYKTIISLRR